MNKFNILAGVVGVIAAFTGYLFFSSQSNDVISVGTELPQAVALFETSLAAPITSTADTMTLTSNSVRGGGTLSGYNCFTIDEGSAQAEFVCGTVATTTVSGLTRGISPLDGTSEDADLKFSHRRGASVKITDFPIIQVLRNQNNGEATFENALRYAASVVPASANDLADVGYVLSVVNGGTVDFDALVVSGTAGDDMATSTLVYLAVTDQRWYPVDTDSTVTFQNRAIGLTRGSATLGNAIGGGGVLLKGLQTGLSGLTAGGIYYASSSMGTFSTATSVMPIGFAKSTTELQFDPVMINIPRLSFDNTWTGANTFSATTTFSEASITGHASTTVIYYTSGTSTWTKKPGLEYIVVEGVGGGGASSGMDVDVNLAGTGAGGGAYFKKKILAANLGSTETVVVGAGGVGTNSNTTCTNATSGGTTSFGSHASATGGIFSNCGAGTGQGGTATGGDLNISGQPGSSNYDSYPGVGGDSMLGLGGVNTAQTDAVTGTGYGAGASGPGFDDSGANGTAGIVIVTEFY